MMSLSAIQEMSRRAARHAAKAGQTPFIVERDDIAAFRRKRRFPFPFIGGFVPPGWELVEKHFVDASGMGQPDEPALTVEQFCRKLVVGRGYAVVEAGPFQGYVGEFVRSHDSVSLVE